MIHGVVLYLNDGVLSPNLSLSTYGYQEGDVILVRFLHVSVYEGSDVCRVMVRRMFCLPVGGVVGVRCSCAIGAVPFEQRVQRGLCVFGCADQLGGFAGAVSSDFHRQY